MSAARALAPFAHALRDAAVRLARAGRRRAAARTDLARLSSRVLAKGATVHVIRWNGEELLVGCTDQAMVVLARRDVSTTGKAP